MFKRILQSLFQPGRTMLHDHPDLRIRIEVHTDGAGEAEFNRDLSERRAESLRRILTDDYGVAANRLEAEGLGGDRPLDDNDTAEGRQNNRRVELARP
ncbi:MAG TPA: OmpA family protein [Acidobacteriota bacterium]|nr:OmpA family protein [Acidobacteriota bacterium]